MPSLAAPFPFEIGIASIENKLSGSAARRDLTIEAGAAAGMASPPIAAGFDGDQQGVLVAIGPDFDDFLDLAGGIALPPKRLSGS